MNGAVPVWNKRINDFMANGIAPCPDCGAELPAGDTAVRQAHFAACPGKRVDAPVIEIDAEFKALIPSLSDDEYAALGTSLLAEGCRDALIVWRHESRLILVDGHNRHEICTQHNIPFKVLEREFTDRNDVIVWMLRNQLGRRNLTDSARIRAAVRLKEVFEAEAKERQLKSLKQYQDTVVPNSAQRTDDAPQPKSRDKAAGMAGVGKTKFSEGEYVIENAPAAVQARWDNGESSTHAVYLFTKALQGKPAEVIELALRVAGDTPDKVDTLASLHKSSQHDGSNNTFGEIAATGGFQYGDEMELWCDFAESGVLAIKEALRTLSRQHAQIEGDNKATKSGGVPPALTSSESNEYYTPAKYLEAVRTLMGGIDLDPASNPEANQVVQAAQFYSQADNGFAHEWRGRVFLNPPYGYDAGDMSNQERWSARLIEQYEAGNVTEAILLVNAVTDRQWFQPLWKYPICFTDHRIRFYRPGGEPGTPVIGSVFVYFGANVIQFARVFCQFGAVVLTAIQGNDDDAE